MPYKKKMTAEEKKAWAEKKEQEKKDIKEAFETFLEEKTIEEIVGIVSKYKDLHKYSVYNRWFLAWQGMRVKEFRGLVNGFSNWKKQGYMINKGAKALKVWIPIIAKKKAEDVNTIQIGMDDDGNIVSKPVDEYIRFFKLGNVFDISQTDAFPEYLEKEKLIDEKIMKNSEIKYKTAIKFIQENFPEIKIEEDFKEQDCKGSYNRRRKTITIHERSSHTAFHEIGHHISIKKIDKPVKSSDFLDEYAKNEVIAELSCYMLMQKFGVTDYNYNYSNVWSSRIKYRFTLKEFENLYVQIRDYIEALQF